VPAKNRKMVTSKKSAVSNKPKMRSLTKVSSSKTKKGATRTPSFSKIKHKSTSSKSKTSTKPVAKVAKVLSKKSAPASKSTKVATKVTRPVPSKTATSIKTTTTKVKVSLPPVEVAVETRTVVIEPVAAEPIKQKEAEKKAASKAAAELKSTTQGALKAFEMAMTAFSRQNYNKAKEVFEELLTRYAAEAEIAARVRTYLAICVQRLAPPKSFPQNIGELYNQGVVELNRGHIEKAVDLFERALKLQPQADYLLYSLAAAQSRLGAVREALDNLRRSIDLDRFSRNRVNARRDPDFSPLYENREFQEIVGLEVEHEPASENVEEQTQTEKEQ
jgi:hypothetical protein